MPRSLVLPVIVLGPCHGSLSQVVVVVVMVVVPPCGSLTLASPQPCSLPSSSSASPSSMLLLRSDGGIAASAHAYPSSSVISGGSYPLQMPACAATTSWITRAGTFTHNVGRVSVVVVALSACGSRRSSSRFDHPTSTAECGPASSLGVQ